MSDPESMRPRYRSVAVIGTGPSGISAVRALVAEDVFDRIQVYERREKVGGIWHYDVDPEPFLSSERGARKFPAKLPQSLPSAPEDTSARTGVYDSLDSNVGAEAMEFTHTPFPKDNSAASVDRYGKSNPTRPFRTVAGYLEDLAEPYSHLISLNTTVERVEKTGKQWTVTLRRTDHRVRDQKRDYWWQDKFDAVIAATGHYNVPYIPNIAGLRETFERLPGSFEHSKAYRSPDHYVNKKVVVVGGNVSAADIVSDIHEVVSSPLYLSQRGRNEALDGAWALPNVAIKPQLKEFSVGPSGKVRVEFPDGSTVDEVDKVHFATGYKLSYPFLVPNPVTPSGRLAGFYQHVFSIADPSLTVIGQVKAAISFRVYEYQAVAVARYYAGRGGGLPSPREQDEWEVSRLQYKGPTSLFHEIKPDFAEYFGFLRDVAGIGQDGYQLPEWKDEWAALGFGVLALKDQYWKEVKERQQEKEKAIRSKL